jgi:hypothetical protein
MSRVSHDNKRTSLYNVPEFTELLRASFSTAVKNSVASLKSWMKIQKHKQYVIEILLLHVLIKYISGKVQNVQLGFQQPWNVQLQIHNCSPNGAEQTVFETLLPSVNI